MIASASISRAENPLFQSSGRLFTDIFGPASDSGRIHERQDVLRPSQGEDAWA
jgi:hypothetical protein